MSNTISASQLMMQMGQMKSQATSHPILENNPLSLNPTGDKGNIQHIFN